MSPPTTCGPEPQSRDNGETDYLAESELGYDEGRPAAYCLITVAGCGYLFRRAQRDRRTARAACTFVL